MSQVVIAPDSFKGSATAVQVAEALTAGWRRVRPGDEVVSLPLADGGEGTLDAVEFAVPASRRMPVLVGGRKASWLLLPDGTGVVELASTCGITLGPADPLGASTHAFGEAVAAALDHGVTRLLLAIGGSRSTDGGAGALTALGARFRQADGTPIGPGGGGLPGLASADLSGLPALPPGGAVILSDVVSPLLGPRGAAAVFGPQKGASPAQVDQLERGLVVLADRLADVDPAAPGAGAAGGTGFGLMAWGATVSSGAQAVLDLVRFSDRLAGAGTVVTGEGQYDEQTSSGKALSQVLAVAGRHAVPVRLVAGRIAVPTPGFADRVSLTELAGSAEAAMGEPLIWLERAGAELAKRYENP